MLAGGQAQLYTGIGASGATIAAAEAAATGGAVMQSTFSGSALAAAQGLGVISSGTAFGMWQTLSTNFASGAGSASVLFGPEATAAKTFATHELPALVANGASIVIQYIH